MPYVDLQNGWLSYCPVQGAHHYAALWLGGLRIQLHTERSHCGLLSACALSGLCKLRLRMLTDVSKLLISGHANVGLAWSRNTLQYLTLPDPLV